LSNPIKLDKTYGAVHCKNHISFFGFAKKIGNSKTQIVDIYINDKLINSIKANKFIQEIYNIYDLEKYAFSYTLPKNEHIEYGNTISFKNQDTQEELLNSPYTFTLTSNEYRFLQSLEEPLSKEFQDICNTNIIGFLASKENLNSTLFVKYIQKIMHDFSSFNFKAFYINEEDKNLIKKYFNINSLEVTQLSHINTLFSNIEIFLANNLNNMDFSILNYFRSFRINILALGLNIDLDKISIEEFEKQCSFDDIHFNVLNNFGFDISDQTSYYALFYKQAKKKFNINLDFSIKDPMYKASIYLPLLYCMQNKEFTKFFIDYLVTVQEERNKLIK